MDEASADTHDTVVALHTGDPDVAIRDKIDRLENAMRAMPQIAIEPRHYFADGLYAREITIPAGVTLTGKVHRREHINVLSKGTISVLTEYGIQMLSAPATIVSRPGTKRVGYAHTEVVWTTFHTNEDNERDVDVLELRLVANTREEAGFLAGATAPAIEGGA